MFTTKMITAALFTAAVTFAHCDSLKGPVVQAARRALTTDDVNAVLAWVPANQESTIKQAFAKTKAVRALGPEAERLADTWFFETVVRIHRAGEGAPYSGLKDDDVPSGIAIADAAMVKGDIVTLTSTITAAVADDLRQRYARLQNVKEWPTQDVNARREYVAAYVDFIHLVERLDTATKETKGDQDHVH